MKRQEWKAKWGRRGQNLNKEGKINKKIKRWVIKGGWSGPLVPKADMKEASTFPATTFNWKQFARTACFKHALPSPFTPETHRLHNPLISHIIN